MMRTERNIYASKGPTASASRMPDDLASGATFACLRPTFTCMPSTNASASG